MNYCAYITKVKELRPHTNADKLQIATVFGNNVIVGLDLKLGDLMVYFPTDGRLGVEYCEENNLLRKKDTNGKEIGGYLDPNKRHVSTIKLRGEYSDGLLMAVSSLSKFTDVSKLKEGDTITLLNDVKICEKYIPRRNHSQNLNNNINKIGKKKKTKIEYPYFTEHKDTLQLAYNIGNFREGDLCVISLKQHGCFQASSLVKLWGVNKAKPISKIKKGDVVVGYDNGKFVPSKVRNIFINGKTKKWQHLQISRLGKDGEQIQNIKCTPEHLFWDNFKQEWIPSSELKEGDVINTIKRTFIMSNVQKEVLVGKFLGNGYLKVLSGSAEIQFSHKKEHEEYVDYTLRALNGMAYKQNKEYISGYGTIMVRAKTHRTFHIKSFFDNILSIDTNNKLNNNIINYFSPVSMAFLYMDDGHLSHSESQKDRAGLAVCDYNTHDCKIIIKCFQKYGIDGALYKDSEGYNRIRFNKDSASKLFNLIHTYIPPILRYKLPEEYRHLQYHEVLDSSLYEDGYLFDAQTILKNDTILDERNKGKYDIETETHNYVVGDCLVHNSSARTSHSIKTKKKYIPSFLFPIFKKLKISFKIKKSWEYVSGSRRVVLTNFNSGYYGNDNFRKKWHDYFIGKLHKGETIYYEIVGYTEGNQLIMPECNNSKTKDKEFIKQYGETTKFTYGCGEGENNIFVYRMTMANEDGVVIEYPTDLITLRCEQMGINQVPIFDKFIFTTKEDLMERVNTYVDGTDPIGINHIREGVVVRIENREQFKAYKHKSYNFKILEGIIKESDVLDMEEAEDDK